MASIAVVILIVTLFTIISAEKSQPHFASKDDTAHVREHLQSKIDVEKMSEQQERFHHFKHNDLNEDGFIDGLELIAALTHEHDAEVAAELGNGPQPPIVVKPDKELETIVDAVLTDLDVNMDGRIDFGEYMSRTGNS